MKLASISVVSVSLLLCMGALGLGCSSGRTTHPSDTGPAPRDMGMVIIPDTGGPRPDTGGGGTPDTGVGPRDMGITVRDTGPRTDAGTCTATCSSDSQCTAACGAVPGGGIRCCDTSTSRCFVSHTAMCPAPGMDGGGMSY